EHEFRRAAVGADEPLDVGVGPVGALVAHGGQVQALVENLARLARAASRHRPADVALVRDRAAEAEQLAADEDRRDDRDVRRVRAAAMVGVLMMKASPCAMLSPNTSMTAAVQAGNAPMCSGNTTCCATTSPFAFISAQDASCDSRTMVEKPVRNSEFCISCTMPERLAFSTSRSTASMDIGSVTRPASRSGSSIRR